MPDKDLHEINIAARIDPAGMIAAAEKRYYDELSSLADKIAGNGRLRIIMLAGPSGAGKTTSANILADLLIARGRQASVVSLDHFYRESDDPAYPLTPDGNRDCESIDALDTEKIASCLSSLIAGRRQIIYKYDFAVGKPGRDAIVLDPGDSGIIIAEGLHALNPRLLYGIPLEYVCRVFVSVSTNLTVYGQRILSGRRMRFLRRLVRDNLYRSASAERTIGMWRDVMAGEDKYLYPYKGLADYSFDTFHDFELGVIKPFVDGLLTGETLKDDYAASVRMALDIAEPIELGLVPEDSLIKEFIPGGKYEDLY